MECYSVLKGREILTHATKWMSLEDIMLSEIGQSLKDKYCVYNSTYRRSLEEPKSQKQEVDGGCLGLREGEEGVSVQWEQRFNFSG